MTNFYGKMLFQFWFDAMTVAFAGWILEYIVHLPSLFAVCVGLAIWMFCYAFAVVSAHARKDKSNE